MKLKRCRNLLQNRPQEGPKSLKIDLWCCLGTLLGTLLERQQDLKNNKHVSFLGRPGVVQNAPNINITYQILNIE